MLGCIWSVLSVRGKYDSEGFTENYRDTVQMGPAICRISTISIALDSKMTSWLCQSLGLSKWLLPVLQEGLECVTWKLLLTIHSICCSIISHSPYSNKRSKTICCPSSRYSTWTLSSSRNSFKNSICGLIFLEDLQPKLKQMIYLFRYSFQAFISFKILEDYLKQKLNLVLLNSLSCYLLN